MSDKNIQEKLDAVKKSYAASLNEKALAIQDTWKLLCGDWEKDLAHKLHIIIHGLAGSAETFGFPKITNDARYIVDILKQLDKAQQRPDSTTMEELTNKITALSSLLKESADIK